MNTLEFPAAGSLTVVSVFAGEPPVLKPLPAVAVQLVIPPPLLQVICTSAPAAIIFVPPLTHPPPPRLHARIEAVGADPSSQRPSDEFQLYPPEVSHRAFIVTDSRTFIAPSRKSKVCGPYDSEPLLNPVRLEALEAKRTPSL